MSKNNFTKKIVLLSTEEVIHNGVILCKYNSVVSAYHSFEGYRKVLLRSVEFGRKLLEVNFMDPFYGIAVFHYQCHSNDHFYIKDVDIPLPGQHVKVIMQTFSRGLIEISSIVIKTVEKKDFVFFQISVNNFLDKILGSLVLNNLGEPLGIVVRYLGNDRLEVMPIKYLQDLFIEYANYENDYAFRCPFCAEILTEELVMFNKCAFCGEILPMDLYKPKHRTLTREIIKIETVISNLNYKPEMTVLGPNFWEIEKFGMNILFHYDQDSNALVLYSVLIDLKEFRLKETDIKTKIYDFLLRENQKFSYIFFSLNEQKIILTSIYLDLRYVHVDFLTDYVRDFIVKLIDYKNKVLSFFTQ